MRVFPRKPCRLIEDQEMDVPHAAVGENAAHRAPDPPSVARHAPVPVMHEPVKGQRQKHTLPVEIEAHALVRHRLHLRLQEFCARAEVRRCIRRHDRKGHHRFFPFHAVPAARDERMPRHFMLIHRIGQIFTEVIPEGLHQHRRMIVCPPEAVGRLRMRAVGAQDLKAFDAGDMRQRAVLKAVIRTVCVEDFDFSLHASSLPFSSFRYSTIPPRMPARGRYSNIESSSRTRYTAPIVTSARICTFPAGMDAWKR